MWLPTAATIFYATKNLPESNDSGRFCLFLKV